ncbi:hypothetical protein [Clostridium sp.]|uniref:hypothetical protein n=1 Tax=Clostridium sp. TaxID=1506 RepID=UPI0025C15CA5|nr:hypothetical protein [Clostridium sp.]
MKIFKFLYKKNNNPNNNTCMFTNVVSDELEYCKEIKKQVDNIKDLVILLIIWVSFISIIFCVGLGKSYDDIKQDIKEISIMEK